MAGETYYKDEVGRRVQIQTGMDWTGNTSARAIKILRPDGTNVVKTGADVIVDDAPTGVVSFLTIASDHNITGPYYVQAKLVTASTSLWSRLDYYWVEDVA